MAILMEVIIMTTKSIVTYIFFHGHCACALNWADIDSMLYKCRRNESTWDQSPMFTTVPVYIPTVKFLNVAASLIKAPPPQTFKKILFFWQKFPNWKTSNWSRRATFEICQGPIFVSRKSILNYWCLERTTTRCWSKRAASYANHANGAHAV